VMARDEIIPVVRRSRSWEPDLPGFRSLWRKPMTKLTFMVAALVAASAYTSEASAARSHVASRHAQATTAANGAGDCMRAPNVGAYASDPYTQPPCMPNTGN
jgi:hypothetical protein